MLGGSSEGHMANTIRDDRVDPEELENSLQLRRRSIEKARPRVRDRALAREARNLCRDDGAYFTRCYTVGVPVGELADALDEWAADFVASAEARREASDGAPDFLAQSSDRRLFFATVDLVRVATSLGRADIATMVLTHPAVVAVPARVFDVLAQFHGVPRTASDTDELSFVFGPWVEVATVPASDRQSAFETYVRGWRAHNEEVRSLPRVNEYFTGAWAFEAVALAQVFGLDDEPVRDVPEYPTDLADYARTAGLPRLDDSVRLPALRVESAPPDVIEPDEVRRPIPVSGTVTRANIEALLTPVDGDALNGSTDDALIDAAVEAVTVHMIDWRGVDAEDTAAMLQSVCRKLGIPVPGRAPEKARLPLVAGIREFDDWLHTAGARLLVVDQDSDDVLVVPVLAADHSTFADQPSDGLRLLSADQFATSQA